MTTPANEPTDGEQQGGTSPFSLEKAADQPPQQEQSPYAQQEQSPYGQQQTPYGAQQSPYGQPDSATPPYGSGYAAQGYGGYGTGSGLSSSGLSIGALVAGVVALLLFWCFFVGIPVGIAAVVLGVVALNKVKAGTGGGRGLALAGVVTGGVAILVSVVLVVAVVATGTVDLSTSP